MSRLHNSGTKMHSPDAEAPYGTAKGFVQSAYLMMSNPARYGTGFDDISFYMSFHLLCGFAVELYLKSFLIHNGYSDKELKHVNTGHNLEKLYELALQSGFQDSGTEALVNLLGSHHKNFEFRYIKRDTKYKAVDLDQIFRALSSIDNTVDAIIGASASRGLQPGTNWVFPSAYAKWRFKGVTF